MRKKEANQYKPLKKLSTPPYLSSQELLQFYNEFALFDKELNLKKLKDAMATQNYQHTNKTVFKFIEEQIAIKEKEIHARPKDFLYNSPSPPDYTIKKESISLSVSQPNSKQIKVQFQEYISNMIAFLQQQPQQSLLSEYLLQQSNSQMLLDNDTLKQLLQQSLGRQISIAQMKQIRQVLQCEEGGLRLDSIFGRADQSQL